MYSAFYGLKQEPFRLTPDPRFLHLAETHRDTLRAMVEGITARKGLQISVGPIGTGKTTLLYCLQHILAHEASPQQPLRSAFLVNPTLTEDELFEILFDELEISSPPSKPARELRSLRSNAQLCQRLPTSITPPACKRSIRSVTVFVTSY